MLKFLSRWLESICKLKICENYLVSNFLFPSCWISLENIWIFICNFCFSFLFTCSGSTTNQKIYFCFFTDPASALLLLTLLFSSWTFLRHFCCCYFKSRQRKIVDLQLINALLLVGNFGLPWIAYTFYINEYFGHFAYFFIFFNAIQVIQTFLFYNFKHFLITQFAGSLFLHLSVLFLPVECFQWKCKHLRNFTKKVFYLLTLNKICVLRV